MANQMKFKFLQLRQIVAAVFAIAMLSALVFSVGAQGTDPDPNDAAAYYKSKCVACHGQKADKRFDATMAEDQMVEAILKGKKGEKPPNMPGYEAKGVNGDQAKALVNYMKQLKDAPAAN
jgi:mono/diheme cytochrome c family protein